MGPVVYCLSSVDGASRKLCLVASHLPTNQIAYASFMSIFGLKACVRLGHSYGCLICGIGPSVVSDQSECCRYVCGMPECKNR